MFSGTFHNLWPRQVFLGDMNDGSGGDRVIFVAFIDDASWRGVG